MYMNAEIKIKSNNTPAISENAIVNFEGMDYVFVAITSYQFQMLKVETGVKEKGWTEIKNDTAFSGKKIVTNGAYALLMKLKNKSDE